MNEAPGRTLRRGTAQRLEFIEFRLFWEGVLKRGDITERFGVSVPQASHDLQIYRAAAPGNVEYDASVRRYLATESFRPLFLRPNPDRFLAQMKGLADGIIDLEETWFSAPPRSGVLPIPIRKIDPQILRTLLKSVRTSKALHIHYQSMSNPDPQWRWISPHAFGFDGMRWHVRAYCHRRQDFVDFIIGRMLATGEMAAAEGQAKDDWKWVTSFEVALKPNPKLTAGQQRAVALDFGMTHEQVVIPVRYALLYYFEKRLRLDIDSKDPRNVPVVVANQEDFDEALEEAKADPLPTGARGSPVDVA